MPPRPPRSFRGWVFCPLHSNEFETTGLKGIDTLNTRGSDKHSSCEYELPKKESFFELHGRGETRTLSGDNGVVCGGTC